MASLNRLIQVYIILYNKSLQYKTNTNLKTRTVWNVWKSLAGWWIQSLSVEMLVVGSLVLVVSGEQGAQGLAGGRGDHPGGVGAGV